LNVIAVASNPAIVEQQQAKVGAAQQAVAAAQAKVDSIAKALYTSAPGTGPPRSDLAAASQALFDARHSLTEQTATLAGLSQARETLGGQSVPIPALPEHADVQAFPAQPSAFAQGSRALSEGSFGLIPDIAKDIDVFTNWGHHSGVDQAGAVLDAAGLIPIPGAKFLGEAIHLGVDAVTTAHHADDAVHAFDAVTGAPHSLENGAGAASHPATIGPGDHTDFGVVPDPPHAPAGDLTHSVGTGELPHNGDIIPYPSVSHPGTGDDMAFPAGPLERVPPDQRVPWTNMDRYYFIQQWHDMGYADPPGGWDLYDIHHIKPREFGGDNSFENLIPVPRVYHNQRITPWWRNFD
jgi:hypothetical protein